MTSLVRIALAVIVTAYADLTCGQASAAIPDTITAQDERLAWVSARRAVDESGHLKTDLVDSPALRANAQLNRKQRQAQANAAGAAEECRTFLGAYPEHFKSTRSLRDAATGAELIVSGRVLSIDEGFLHNQPGSLLRLSGSAIKGTATEEIYVFYPSARIRTADGLVCARPVGDFQSPAVGDQLIVFSMRPALITGGRTILSVDPPRELIHQSVAGRRLVPAAFAPELDGGLTLQEVERRVAVEAKAERRSK